MSWQHRLPHGISGFRQTGQGFEASVSIPADEEGFFGRRCPDCVRFFKMRVDQWEMLADGATVTCPYCGRQPADVSDFMTPQQNRRVHSAAEALAERYVHQRLQKMFSGLGSRRLRPGESGIEIRVSHDPPPPVRSLPAYAEEQVRRTITCVKCETVYAVYGATAFCPACGPRGAADTVLESIERGRRSLAPEDALPDDVREEARADGIFDKTAADAVKEVVTLFEVFARDQFAREYRGTRRSSDIEDGGSSSASTMSRRCSQSTLEIRSQRTSRRPPGHGSRSCSSSATSSFTDRASSTSNTSSAFVTPCSRLDSGSS
jgi:hypothetical protein